MSLRIAILAAASPLALLAVPAYAQTDERYAGVSAEGEFDGYSDPVIQGAGDFAEEPADTGASYAADSAESTYEVDDEASHHDAARHHAAGHHGHRVIDRRGPLHEYASTAPRLAYGAVERAEWLSQCRALHAAPAEPRVIYADGDRGGNGGLVGGLIGAAVGAGAGNRIADRHRLTGTLVGAGIGGIAGAVIGSVIDNARRRDDEVQVIEAPQEPGFDYCEAYLLNYERGYGTPSQVAYAPVVMMPAAHARHRASRVIEEEIEIEADEPVADHRAHRTITRQVQGDKRIPLD